jgi:D-beta-D-heptose 7-phosphate kinase/D-beta-D-heptose 1-phosphate adenosyltransferase
LSPEAPVPVFTPTRITENGGMAVNVYNNLKALGIDCNILTHSGATKTRYVDEVSNQMLLRIDEASNLAFDNNEVMRVMSSTMFEIDYEKYDAIVISDYDKGYLSIDDIIDIINHHSLVFMDTKKKLGNWAKDVNFIKINQKEFDENVSYDFVREYQNNLIVTKGKQGAMWINTVDGLKRMDDFPIEAEHEVRDLSGAGDTFLAALVADYIKNNDIRRAICYANRCAAWVVTQKGVVVVDKEKI